MIHEDLLNIVRREAERVVERRASGIRVGLVQSYDKTLHAVKLALQPEGTLSGWIPLSALGVGNNFGVYVGPHNGQAFAAYFHEGDLEAGIIVGRLPTDAESPVQVGEGEIAIHHESGSLVNLFQDGSVKLQDKNSAIVSLDGSGNITLTGKAGQTVALDASGNITLTPAGSGKVLLGGAATQPAAKNGDAVSGGLVVATSTKVAVL